MKMPPTDVVLVTGYLGAGKSTLLNQLLQLPEIVHQQPALIINEFGQEGVDGRLFDDVGCPMFEINRGSLFLYLYQDGLTRGAQRDRATSAWDSADRSHRGRGNPRH